MAAKTLKIEDYAGYIKCGEILKSPLPNCQHPFILRCYQCYEINFILESFVLHIQEHCKAIAVKRKTNDIEIADKLNTLSTCAEVDNQDEFPNENVNPLLVEMDTALIEMDDPLIAIKNDNDEQNTPEDVKTYFEDSEDSSWNSEYEFQTGETKDNKVPTKKKRKKTLSPTVDKFIRSRQNMSTLIELYKNQPNLWNKDLPYYRFRDKRRLFLAETAKNLNKELNSKYTWKEVSDIIGYIYKKHREDFKRLRLYEEEEDKDSKDKKYKRCWFFEDLYFLRPKPVIQLEKLDTNLPDLSTDQIIEIIQIYREFPQLWNTNLVEFICSNKRNEAKDEMLKNIESNMNINISKSVLEEYLRTLHYYFSREKHLRKKNTATKSKIHAEDFYDQLLYLYDHEGPFNCPNCKRVFKKAFLFKVHMSNHYDFVPFTCSECNKEFKTIPSYTVHAKRHFEDLEFACNVCNRKFLAYADLRVHLLTHSGDRPYCCEVCGTSFRRIHCFKRHQRRHDNRYTHVCSICSKGYYSKDRFEDHMNAHMNIRSHICQLCGKGFITSRALKTHAVTHEDARNHACKMCGKTFKLKVGVLQHMRTHRKHGMRTESDNKN